MTPIIKPKQSKTPDQLLTDEHIKHIITVLDQSCTGRFCISREQLYEAIKEPLKLTIELYQFEQAMTHAIRSGRIIGFETRTGKSGGICRAGVFAEHDADRKTKVATKPARECMMSFNEKVFSLPISEIQASALIISAFKAKPANDGKANIFVNNAGYKVSQTSKTLEILEELIVNIMNGKTIVTDQIFDKVDQG